MGFICKHFDGKSYCYHKDESTTKHECEHECEISEKVSDYFEKNATDINVGTKEENHGQVFSQL